MPPIFLVTATTTLFLFILVFLISVALRNNGLVDILWGLGFIAISLLIFLFSPSLSTTALLILVSIWGTRLAVHIYLRNQGKQEDFRYAKWRAEWGQWWVVRTFLQVFLLQWFLMQLVSLPLVLVVDAPSTPPQSLLGLGILIWLIGFYFEAVGDYQLTRFKSQKGSSGKLMTTGLWRYTRHPNYFGEATLWWGIALIAYATSHNLLVFFGPLTIDFLLLKVSGIPLLEAKYKGRKDWSVYARHTSSFFPFPPKK